MKPFTAHLRRPARRGNTLVLVTAILVLLVIIATAYISRAQGGRVIAAAQRTAIDREDRATVAVGVVAKEISESLFPKLVDASDPAIQLFGSAATSSTPRLSRPEWFSIIPDFNGDPFSVNRSVDRYSIDPQTTWNLDTGLDYGLLAPYNVAPYETRPWTNWPDSTQAGVPFGEGAVNGVLYDEFGLLLGDDNPVGNPGFGDTRWLRSSEPQPGYINGVRDLRENGRPYSHWAHLSWPATAENGWRVCFDIANVAPFSGIYNIDELEDPRTQGFTITNTAAEAFASGLANDYMNIPGPVALQTPYEQWLTNLAPDPATSAQNFKDRRNAWFGDPATHFQALYSTYAMPNFFRLNDLGPRHHTFLPESDRNIIERTLADADGDGFTDSFWFLLPGLSEDGVRQVAAVSIVDNAGMVDLNVATRFDRVSTAGHTPADLALTSRLVVPDAQAVATGEGAFPDTFDATDTRVGLFSDPQNETPYNANWTGGVFSHEMPFEDQIEFPYKNSVGGGSDPSGYLGTGFDPYRFGDSTIAESSFLRQVGVLNQNAEGAAGYDALESPYRSLLVAFGDGDPRQAEFDRRRYFNRRMNDGGLYTNRTDASNGAPLPLDEWTVGYTPPRGFGDADELELRMFSASNYGPVVSSLERTLNKPWAWDANFLRSSLARSESVENHLDFYAGNQDGAWPPNSAVPVGDQLSAAQLARDSRHRMTTYSATRNDLRPLHLRPTALYEPYYDYAFNRLRPDPSDPNIPPNQEANRLAFEVRKQKVDLRSPLDAPLSEFESILYQFFPGPFSAGSTFPGGPDNIVPGLWPYGEDPAFGAHVELDRAFRFRTELQQTIGDAAAALYRDGDSNYTQSYLGSNYEDYTENQIDYLRTLLMAASWSANIDTFRDDRARPAFGYLGGSPPTFNPGLTLDTPIFPDWAPRIDQSLEGFLPPELQNVTFPGLEKQPFIMESFFCLVYPPSRISTDLADELSNDAAYQQFLQDQGESEPEAGDDSIPFGFKGSGDKWVDADSEPAIVFAIQLANPFEEPVPLHDLFLRIGDSNTINQCLNLGKLASPHPQAPTGAPYYLSDELWLGPTQPEAPRTAIVFGIIPPGNNVSGGSDEGSFEYEFGMPYEEFHRKWMDFLDLEPGALFGWERDQPLATHQTLVLDASPQTFIRSSPGAPGTAFTPTIPPLVGLKPDRWFGDGEGGELDQSVELLRFVTNPLTYNPDSPFNSGGYLYAIDRLDNEVTGDKVEFSDQMKRLVEEDFAPTMDQEYNFEYPGPPERNEWSGIRLEGGDLLASWVRAGRAWGWDINRNGIYDLDEISPRYIYPELPEDDWIRSEVKAEEVGAGEFTINGTIIDWDDDPDVSTGGEPWLTRAYLSPIGLTPSLGASSFGFDFASVRGKPVHLTTAAALVPSSVGGGGNPQVDYDAGFPTLEDGSPRVDVDASGWPGRPAANYRWMLMNKGQGAEEALPGNRGAVLTGVDSNGNGVDDALETYSRVWLEKDQWAFPLQMLQKDADFEQIGEIANPFLWGHVIHHRPGITTPDSLGGVPLLPTRFTFGEIMDSTKADDLIPVVKRDFVDGGFPNRSRIKTNRFYVDPGNVTAPVGTPVESFRPFTQVVEVATVDEPWTPRLPAGVSLYDAVVCDGPGCNYQLDLDGNGSLDARELLAIEDDRYGNAGGFSGKGTRGLLNLNTASVEVLRTLPHMSRLVYNDNTGWPLAQNGSAWEGWNAFGFAALPAAGEGGGTSGERNPQYVRVPESILAYREGGGLANNGLINEQKLEPLNMPLTDSVAQAFYDDRGFYSGPDFAEWVPDDLYLTTPNNQPGFFPGMRRGSGIVSLGELTLLNREGPAPSWPADASRWPLNHGSIEGAAGNPYSYQATLDGFSGVDRELGLAWLPRSSPAFGVDARLSTDRRNLVWQQNKNFPESTVEIPDNVAGDAEEANLLFAGISNLVSVRSDTFTVHMRVRSFKQNPVTGVWSAVDPEFVVDDSRYVFVVDRSKCDLPGQEPDIRLFAKIPN